MKYLKMFEEFIIEDAGMTSATGGPVVSGGMGAVVNSQPSALPGTTTGIAWSANGGTIGSGDISIPYNASGGERVFQQIPAPAMSNVKNKKTKKLKNIKDVKAKISKSEEADDKVMNYQDFVKFDINQIKR